MKQKNINSTEQGVHAGGPRIMRILCPKGVQLDLVMILFVGYLDVIWAKGKSEESTWDFFLCDVNFLCLILKIFNCY